ncbi:MAG: tetratricopeptide repeat protein [Gemmatimonadaceae bacterium]
MEVAGSAASASRVSVPTASSSAFIGTFGVVLALIAFFLVFDAFVARIDTEEARSRALSGYREGTRLLAAGQLGDAAEQFRTAASMDRENLTYKVALARVTLRKGDTETAEGLLLAILQQDPTDGAANVLMARVLVEQRRIDDAIAYYHRAVYGRWRAGEGGSSLQARFELIDLLAAIKARKELLAELLPIQDQSLGDVALRDHIGFLFLLAESPARAADVFGQVLRKSPKDAEAAAGLGEASLALGEYATAENQLARAARLSPRDTAVTSSLELAHELVAMDPSRRGLRLQDRYQRTRRLLLLTVQTVARCPLDGAASATAAAADSALGRPRIKNGDALDDLVQSDLALSQRLWRMRPASCAVESSREEKALALLQDALARS